MSHASAVVRFADGSYWFAEYDGTSDQVLDRIYPTKDMLRLAWRGDALLPLACTCGAAPEAAEYAEDYGGGSWGAVTACRTCCVLVNKSSFYANADYASGPNGGHPDWWQDAWTEALSLELSVDAAAVLADLSELHGVNDVAAQLRNRIAAQSTKEK